MCLIKCKPLQEQGAITSVLSNPAAASSAHLLWRPFLHRCRMSSLGNLQRCALVVKDSFPISVWCEVFIRLGLFSLNMSGFSLTTCNNPTPSMCRALTPSLTPPFHKYYFTHSQALQIAQSSGICHLSVKAISSKLQYL